MTVTLATVADALIEFILSLLRDPDAAAEFDADPQAALNARGLNGVSHADACAVAPVVLDRANVIAKPVVESAPAATHVVRTNNNTAVDEIQNIVNNFSWLHNTSTIVDQSTNQNIWAGGDVTQIFDQEANVAAGEDSIAAGNDVSTEQTQDNSTNITAGDDVNVGNDTDVAIVDGSFNETTDGSQTTDGSETTIVTDSLNDTSAGEQPALTDTGDDAGGAAPVSNAEVAYVEAPVESAPEEPIDDGLTPADDLPPDDDL